LHHGETVRVAGDEMLETCGPGFVIRGVFRYQVKSLKVIAINQREGQMFQVLDFGLMKEETGFRVRKSGEEGDGNELCERRRFAGRIGGT